MEMKPGYKKTEVGVIPDDWEVKPIAQIATVGRGRVISHKEIARARSPLYPVYSSQTSDDGVMGYLDSFEFEGDYITWTTDGANAGTVFARSGRFNCTNVCGTIKLSTDNHRFVAKVLSGIAPRHVSRHLGNPKLMNDVVKRINVPLPPTRTEQDDIATALSDVDGLLGGLDRLITKKRDLKQATMQNLLTGQIRLPGFYDEWQVMRLGDVFAITAGKSKSAYIATDGDYWICDMGSVSTEGRLIVSKRTNYCGDFLKRGDLIMPKDDIGGGNIIGKVGYINANETYILGDHVYCLRALEGAPRFLAYIINSHRVNMELRKKVIGSAQLGLGRKSVEEQAILFPQYPEQTAIAEVLTEIDAELAALEQRREKTRALKQAMMQELLTGRTRLV